MDGVQLLGELVDLRLDVHSAGFQGGASGQKDLFGVDATLQEVVELPLLGLHLFQLLLLGGQPHGQRLPVAGGQGSADGIRA